jgi:hypothetical protein
LNGGAAGEIDDAEVGAVFVTGESARDCPGGALVDEEAEEDQVQRDGSGSVVGVVPGGGDWFAYGFDVCASLLDATIATCLAFLRP